MTDLSATSIDSGLPSAPATDSTSVWPPIRRELVYLSFAVQEASLLAPFAMVLMSWSRFWQPGLVFLWLLLLMVLPFNLLRLMSLLQWDRRRQQRVMAVAMIIAVFLSWRTLLYESSSPLDFSWISQFATNLAEGGNLVWTRDLSIFIFTIFAWWRGMRLAVKPLSIHNAGMRLRVGGLVIAPLIAWLGTSFLSFSVVPFILLFFLASLSAVALVRAEQIEADRTGHSATLGPGWFLTVLAAGLGIVLLGGALAAFLSGKSLFEVLSIFSPLWRALQFAGTAAALTMYKLLSPLLDALSVLVQLLAAFFAAILGRLSDGVQVLSSEIFQQGPLPTPEATTAAISTPTGAPKVIAVVIMLAIVGLVAWGLSRVYRQATFASRESSQSDPIARDGDDEPGLFDRLMQRMGLFQQWRAAASIRRIYASMCHTATSAGYPRLEAETPYEYLAALQKAWPDNQGDTRLITEAFIRIRYGELPETQEELDAIREAWRRLESSEPNRLYQPTDTAATLEKRQ